MPGGPRHRGQALPERRLRGEPRTVQPANRTRCCGFRGESHPRRCQRCASETRDVAITKHLGGFVGDLRLRRGFGRRLAPLACVPPVDPGTEEPEAPYLRARRPAPASVRIGPHACMGGPIMLHGRARRRVGCSHPMGRSHPSLHKGESFKLTRHPFAMDPHPFRLEARPRRREGSTHMIISVIASSWRVSPYRVMGTPFRHEGRTDRARWMSASDEGAHPSRRHGRPYDTKGTAMQSKDVPLHRSRNGHAS
jgi:hypothetical protein